MKRFGCFAGLFTVRSAATFEVSWLWVKRHSKTLIGRLWQSSLLQNNSLLHHGFVVSFSDVHVVVWRFGADPEPAAKNARLEMDPGRARKVSFLPGKEFPRTFDAPGRPHRPIACARSAASSHLGSWSKGFVAAFQMFSFYNTAWPRESKRRRTDWPVSLVWIAAGEVQRIDPLNLNNLNPKHNESI